MSSPPHPPVRVYIHDYAIAERRVLLCVRAKSRVFGWWNRNLNFFAEAFDEKIAVRVSVVGSIRQEPDNRAVDLIQQARQRDGISDALSGQIGADDLAADKIETEVQLAPGPTLALGFMPFL